VLDRLGIADRFDAICDGNAVSAAKPAPDLFLAAASAIGLDPSACIVFEDAEDGVKAAHVAGMRVVGIGPADRVGEADTILPDLARADLDAVLEIGRQGMRAAAAGKA
jgi:beta-phosphoglucomutase